MIAPARFLIHYYTATPTRPEGHWLWDRQTFVGKFKDYDTAFNEIHLRANSGDKMNYFDGKQHVVKEVSTQVTA